MLQCHVDGSFGMCDGRVDERHRAGLGFDEHAELGAPEDYGLRTALDKVRDRSVELLPRSGQKDAFGKLCVQRIVHVSWCSPSATRTCKPGRASERRGCRLHGGRRAPDPGRAGQSVVEVEPVFGDAELPQPLPLRGEVLRVGRATTVADESGGHRPTVTDSQPPLRLFAYQVSETAEGGCLGTS